MLPYLLVIGPLTGYSIVFSPQGVFQSLPAICGAGVQTISHYAHYVPSGNSYRVEWEEAMAITYEAQV